MAESTVTGNRRDSPAGTLLHCTKPCQTASLKLPFSYMEDAGVQSTPKL